MKKPEQRDCPYCSGRNSAFLCEKKSAYPVYDHYRCNRCKIVFGVNGMKLCVVEENNQRG